MPQVHQDWFPFSVTAFRTGMHSVGIHTDLGAMQMMAASGQDFQSSQLCFEWPHTRLNRTGVFAETDEALFSVYSNSAEHSVEIKSCNQDLCLYKICLYKDWNT